MQVYLKYYRKKELKTVCPLPSVLTLFPFLLWSSISVTLNQNETLIKFSFTFLADLQVLIMLIIDALFPYIFYT